MDIKNFLPIYPEIHASSGLYKYLNSGKKPDFFTDIYTKKEFYVDKLTSKDEKEEDEILFKHQSLIYKFLSTNTPYNSLLLVHEMGSGKSCSAIGVAENIKDEIAKSLRRKNIGTTEETETRKKEYSLIIYLAPNKNLINNFIYEIINICTGHQYLSLEEIENIPRDDRLREFKKVLKHHYNFYTFNEMSNILKTMSDADIIKNFSNKVFIIDEVHRLRLYSEKSNQELLKYNQIKRMCETALNTKILLLSGTPMVDRPSEIANIMNLILDEKLPVETDFDDRYMIGSTLDERRAMELKHKFKGKVSYLRAAQSDVKRVFMGEIKLLYGFTNFSLKYDYMQSLQSNTYIEAYKKDLMENPSPELIDENEFGEENEPEPEPEPDSKPHPEPKKSINVDINKKDSAPIKGVYSNSRQASLFVFPSKPSSSGIPSTTGLYGKEGFNTWVDVKEIKSNNKTSKKYTLKKEFIEMLIGNSKKEKNLDDELKIRRIARYSSKYADVIKNILLAKDKSVFVYCKFIEGSGSIMFSKMLELFGFTEANGSETTEGLRYALLTSTVANASIIKIKNRFNQPDNMFGKIIKIIIGSDILTEGFSFKNVRQTHILTPSWNYTSIVQALARGMRVQSHDDLINAGIKDITNEFFLYASIPTLSTNYEFEKITNKTLKEFDQQRVDFYGGKEIKNYDSQTSLELTKKYKPGETRHEINTTLFGDSYSYLLPYISIDVRMYRISEEKDKAIKQIDRLLKESAIDCGLTYERNKAYEDGSRECDYMDCNYKCSGIGIPPLLDDKQLSYDTYNLYYSEKTVTKLIKLIINMFKTTFHINLKTFESTFRTVNRFIILTALKTIIDKKYVIINKYGFINYLKEDNNNYFLVDSIDDNGNLLSMFYTRTPILSFENDYNLIIEDLYDLNLVTYLSDLFSRDDKKIVEILQKSPLYVLQKLIELLYNKPEPEEIDNSKYKIIMSYLKSFIAKIGQVDISSILYSKYNILKCYDGNVWRDCDEKEIELYINNISNKFENLKSLAKVTGRVDNNGDFYIVDIRAGDSHKISGKKCQTWKVYELINLIIHLDLEINEDDKIIKDKSREDLIEILKTNPKLVGDLNIDFDTTDDDLLKRYVYWGYEKSRKTANGLCSILKQWLIDNNLVLYGEKINVAKKPTVEAENKVPGKRGRKKKQVSAEE